VDSRLHGRGVARIKLDNGLESNVRAFVERNEPFVCRKCLADTTFWDKDSNILQAVGADTTIPVRVASRTTNNKTPTQFSREAAPGTRGKQTSAYREQNMTMADFMNAYNKHESKEHLYAAQVNIMADLPGLLPHVQETAPPSILLEAVGKTPPRSQRPLRYVHVVTVRMLQRCTCVVVNCELTCSIPHLFCGVCTWEPGH
jgi:hypothetical protein